MDQPADPRSASAAWAERVDREAAQAADELLRRLRQATIGDYDIHSELARGGMASVYLAHDLALDRKVAIKVMSPAMIFGPGMTDRFRREARTAGALSHPNIIPVYTVREAEGLCFFVMKLIEGTTLDGVIRQLGQAPIAMVEAVLAQAGNALGYAHRHGVVHRDVKPGNILIDNEGWVVVTDFGIAKIADAEGLTQTGTAVGTPAYMSPEQCLGGEIGPASDQYSLGMIAYEMLTGRRAFSDRTSLAMMYAHANTEPPPIGELRPDCPERLRQAVIRMLAKDPAARWRTMEDAIKAIGASASGSDESTRGQLGELAKTGTVASLVARAQTPRSPIPVTRRQQPVRPAPTSAILRGGLAGVVVIVVAAVGVQWYRLRDGAGAPAPIVTATAPAIPPAVPAPLPPAPLPTVPAPGRVAPPTAAEPRLVRPPAPAPPPAPVAVARTQTVDSAPVVPAPPQPESTVAPKVATVTQPAVVVTPNTAPVAVDHRSDIEAAIERYREALESGDIGRVQRANPGLTATQREGLVAFFGSGGTLRATWTVRDVVITGDGATATVTGTNRATVPRSKSTDQVVSLRVVLERQTAGWRIVRVAN